MRSIRRRGWWRRLAPPDRSLGCPRRVQHNWDPYWSSSLFGSASWVRYDGTAKASYCAAYTAGNKLTAANTSADFSCNPDFAVFQVGASPAGLPSRT